MVYSNGDDAKLFFETATKCAQTFGIKLAIPKRIKTKGNSRKDFIDAIKENITPACQIVVTVLDQKTKSVYAEVKKVKQ